MRVTEVLMVVFVLWCTSLSANDSAAITITIGNGYDGRETWAGIFSDIEENVPPVWTSSSKSEFSLEVPNTESKLTIVLLKKDSVPFVRQVTSKLLENGLTVDFSQGATLVGSVVTKQDKPITKGSLSITFDEDTYKFPARLPELFEWEIEADGTYSIGGVPIGEHKVTVMASDFMPVSKTVLVSTDNQKSSVDFVLPRAEFVNGHVEVYVDRKRVVGEIDVDVTPSQSQTVEFTIKFDEEQRFSLGPFAEDAKLTLIASLPNGQRSLPKKISLPTENDITLWLYDWVRIFGSVQSQETGEPVPEYSLVMNYLNPVYDVSDPNGEFDVEIRNTVLSVSVNAPGYVLNTVKLLGISLRDVEEFDFGTIELEHAFKMSGRVLARPSLEPIEGARIVRWLNVDADMHDGDIMRWNYSDDTTTDANGEFELDGFRSEGGRILVVAKGYSTTLSTIDDVDAKLDIELDPVGSISGQVVSLAGDPVTAQIHYPGGSTKADDGNFHLNVGEGVHRYRAVADSGRSKVVEIAVESGESVENVRIVIDIIGRVYGTIEGLLKGETVSVWALGAGAGSNTVDADGPYEFFGLETGEYEIIGRTSLNREIQFPITLDESNEVRVDFHFPSGGALSGRVFAGDKPLVESEVLAKPFDTSLPSGRTETDSEGSFLFEALANGKYELEIPRRAFTHEVEVEGFTNVQLTVGDYSVSGQIQAGGSVLDADVRLKGGPKERELTWGLLDRVDASGKFRFDGLPSGTYTIEVSHPDFSDYSQQVEVNHDVENLEIYLEETDLEE